MNDRELLEMAAKAAGYKIKESVVGGIAKLFIAGCLIEWNPRTDDGDALRLAVKLELRVQQYPIYIIPKHSAIASIIPAMQNEAYVHGLDVAVTYREAGNDPCAATRLAIVRVAAEIGKAMP